MTDHENVGYLTWDEFDRFRRAVHKSVQVVPWFRVAGYIKGEAAEVRSPSSNHPLGLPPTWLTAEEITRLSQELRYWPDLEDVAADIDGKDIAMMFTREVETALARWPIEDKPRNVMHVRCSECYRLTLRYRPPEFNGDEVRVKCTECGHVMSGEEFAQAAQMLATEMERVRKEQVKPRKRA